MVGKSGDQLEGKQKGQSLQKVRLMEVSHLSLFGNVQVTTQAVQELCDRNIPICYFSYGGWFRGITNSAASFSASAACRCSLIRASRASRSSGSSSPEPFRRDLSPILFTPFRVNNLAAVVATVVAAAVPAATAILATTGAFTTAIRTAGMGITLDPLHPVVVATGQLDIPLRLRQGMMPQPLLEHRRRNPVENGVPPVGVPEGVRGRQGPPGPPGSMPASASGLLLGRRRILLQEDSTPREWCRPTRALDHAPPCRPYLPSALG